MSGLSAAPSLLKTSGLLTYPTNSSVTWAHGLGRIPDGDRYGAHLVWKGGNTMGFTNGAIIPAGPTGGGHGMIVTADATNLRFAEQGYSFLTRADGGGSFEVLPSNVNVVLWARS